MGRGCSISAWLGEQPCLSSTPAAPAGQGGGDTHSELTLTLTHSDSHSHTHMHTLVHTSSHTYIHSYLYTYIVTYRYTHTETHTYKEEADGIGEGLSPLAQILLSVHSTETPRVENLPKSILG